MFGGLPLGELRSTGKDMVLGRPELWGFGDKGQREGGQKGSVEWERMASGRTGQFYGLTEVVLHWVCTNSVAAANVLIMCRATTFVSVMLGYRE